VIYCIMNWGILLGFMVPNVSDAFNVPNVPVVLNVLNILNAPYAT
jgi:hypothetical protein